MQENGKTILQNGENPLDIYSILRALVKDWWMIITAGILGAMIAYMMVAYAYTPSYTSSMTFIVSAKGSANILSDLNAANEMTETFSEVLNSRLLKKKVQEELNLSYLPGNISTSIVEGTNLMSLRVSAPSPEDAFKIMKSVLNNYSEITDYVLSSVVLDVLEAPQVPMRPSNPINARDMMKKYAIIAMALMAAILALIDYLKDDIKNVKEVEKKLDTKLFGTIYHERKSKSLKSRLKRKNKKGLLISDPTCTFMFVETYKKLRTKLMYKTKDKGKKAKTILVTSVMENEGKSTVAVNIALALAQKSSKVVLIDGDMRRPAVYKILENRLDKKQELGEFLKGTIDAEKILHYDEKTGLHLLIGSKHYSESTEMISSETMQGLIKGIQKLAEYVVIDSPPTSMMADAEVLAEYADVSLLVVRQGMASARMINDSIDMLESGSSELLGCIYNAVKTGVFSGRRILKKYGYGGYKYGYGRYGYGKYGYGKYRKGDHQKFEDYQSEMPREELELYEEQG